jgi:hypothetical protein
MIKGRVMVGGVVAWLKSYTNVPSLPPEYVECNGQTLTDSQSVYNTQTIPDLNGYGGTTTRRFLRGSTSSGGTGGADTHTHTKTSTSNDVCGVTPCRCYLLGCASIINSSSHIPSFYGVVFVMRVK